MCCDLIPGKPLNTSPHPGFRSELSRSIAWDQGVQVTPSSVDSIALWYQLSGLDKNITLPVTLSVTGAGC